jgi:hypothetical protein
MVVVDKRPCVEIRFDPPSTGVNLPLAPLNAVFTRFIEDGSVVRDDEGIEGTIAGFRVDAKEGMLVSGGLGWGMIGFSREIG